MSINKIMNQGKTALAATQIGLSTVSHNISNVNTEGYSRQRVDFVAATPTPMAGFQLGGGVQVQSVTRASTDFINRRLEEEKTLMGDLEGSAEVMSQLETVLQDDGEQGISKAMSRFFNDIRTLSTQPESLPLRAAVRESANSLATRFRTTRNGIDQIRVDLDRRIEGAVTDINQFTKRIGDLNRRIMELEVTGGSANDERDQRDLTLQKLSQIVDVQITPTENGGMNVSSGRIGQLVTGVDPTEYKVVHGEDSQGNTGLRVRQTGPNGTLARDVTEFVGSGSLGGFMRVRDNLIPKIAGQLDEFAYKLSTEVNAVHRQAYGVAGRKDTDFFAPMESVRGAAERIGISDAIKEDPSNIAGSYKFKSAGDNRALLDIADLQDKKLFNRNSATFTDQAAAVVGTLGVDFKAVNDNLDTQRGLIEQLNTAREQVAGVSLDEEAIHLMQFQKAFDASAKVIQVADNLMDTVLNLKKF